MLMDIVGSKPFGLSCLSGTPIYISIGTSIYIYRFLLDPRDTSEPKKLVLELWFNFWFEILNVCYLSKICLNEYLGVDVVGVKLVIATFYATLACTI